MKKKKFYVYAFDCVGCYHYFGENSLDKEGKLYCPSCLFEQDKESPYVEKIAVLYEPEVFDLKSALG